MTMLIPTYEITFPQVRQRDEVGKVFIWGERVFRGIFPGQEGRVRSMFSTGFFGELIDLNYIPKTWMTDYKVEGFSLVLEHEAIWPVIYPQEWTFSMLRDAALLVYKVARVARKYGLDMKDSHGLNVLFDQVTPKYSDLGSFMPAISDRWTAYEEYLRFYYYPLRIWQYNDFVGKMSIFSGNLSPHDAYLMYQYPFTRRLSAAQRQRLVESFISRGGSINAGTNGGKHHDLTRQWLNPKFVIKQLGKSLVPIKSIELPRIVEEIEEMAQVKAPSAWGTYHEDIKEKAKRYERIIEIIIGLEGDVSSAVDLGGNQGRLANLLVERTQIRRVLCADYDEKAVDAGYNKAKASKTGNVSFANYDVMGCATRLRFPPPSKRFKSDVAIALALTHHLILSQGYNLDYIFREIASYARRYVLIEFMPLGLWVTGATPNVPEWYTAEWFRQLFSKHFDVVIEEKLRENNVLFVGKVRNGSVSE